MLHETGPPIDRRTPAPVAPRLDGGRGFHWQTYIFAHLCGGVGIFITGYLVDAALASQGVRLVQGADAFISMCLGLVCATPAVYYIWRLGVYRLLDYFLACLICFTPATIATAFIYPVIDLSIAPPASMLPMSEDALAAFSMSVRLIRAGFLAPIYMLVFWLVYHRWQQRDARL